MRFKRLLALLLAAALALAVLVGCGSGQQSVASALLKLLDGRYPNISIEIDPDLEADLRQAISQAEAENAGDDDAAIRAALEKLVGSTVTFRNLGDGQQGDTTFDLVFYAGTDPDKAAQAAYSQWNIVFANVPDDGKYGTGLAMVETENGIWMLVKATVDKAASRNDDDDDEPEEPEEEIPESGYKKIDDTSYKVYNDIGLTSVLFGDDDSSGLAAARNSGFKDVTIELAANTTYTVSQTFSGNSGVFMGTLQGENKETTIIKLTGSKGLFAQIGVENASSTDNGTVQNITFDVQTDIENTYTYADTYVTHKYAGAVAGQNNGTVTNCTVTDGTITANGEINYAGGLVGQNNGTITSCTVTGGKIQAKNGGKDAYAGGLVGENRGTIAGSCRVENTSVSATAILYASAGGLVGHNDSSTVDGIYSGDGDITATANIDIPHAKAYAGGLVGHNENTVTGTYSGTGKITAQTQFNGTTYRNFASVPYTDNGTTCYTDTDDLASAGTGIGGPTPVPHTAPSLNPSTGSTTTTP